MLLVADAPAQVAAVFTTNKTLARRSSSRRSTSRARRTARAIVVNSGCANACTGDQGCAMRAR
jgi:glutamate N-acetyltransferase/amino-acid N-acetyltransferase